MSKRSGEHSIKYPWVGGHDFGQDFEVRILMEIRSLLIVYGKVFRAQNVKENAEKIMFENSFEDLYTKRS